MHSQHPQQRHCSSRASGLTLIEMLLAITILGGSLVALLTAASRCLSVMKRARVYQEAQWTLGRGEVDFPLAEIEEIEDIEVADEHYENGYIFSREVEEDEDEDGLHIVRTRVRSEHDRREAIEEVVQYLLIPPEEEGE